MKNETSNNLTFLQLRCANIIRCRESFGYLINDWSVADWSVAVAGEFGELCNLLKKRRRGEEINLQDISDEIADTMIYLDLLAARLGIDLAEAVQYKFNQVSDKRNCDIKI